MLDQYFVKGKINGGTMIFIVCYYSTLNMSRNLYYGSKSILWIPHILWWKRNLKSWDILPRYALSWSYRYQIFSVNISPTAVFQISKSSGDWEHFSASWCSILLHSKLNFYFHRRGQVHRVRKHNLLGEASYFGCQQKCTPTCHQSLTQQSILSRLSYRTLT